MRRLAVLFLEESGAGQWKRDDAGLSSEAE